MSEKIIPVLLYETYEKLGTHKYEIINITTEWCPPCKGLKKAMPKLFKTPEFSDKDICVYVVDGDVCQAFEIFRKSIENDKTLSFPMDNSRFVKCLIKKIRDINRKTGKTFKVITEKLISNFGLELKDDKIHLTDSFEELKSMTLPTEKFDVHAYPTLILHKDGEPIDETDRKIIGFLDEATLRENILTFLSM